MSHFKYIIVGGGIAGVTAAETLSDLEHDDKVLLLTAGPLIKAVTNFRKVTKTLAEFDVEERPMFELETQCHNVTVVQKSVSALDAANKEIITSDGTKYIYDKLCICTGANPKIIAEDHPLVLGIRDTETAKVFQQKLKNARRIVIVGNGGIATELAYEIEGCDVLWAVKDDSITSTFIDAGASQFLLPRLCDRKQQRRQQRRTKYKVGEDVGTVSSVAATSGGALGPDWHEGLDLHGVSDVSHRIHVEYKVEVKRLIAPEEIKKSHLMAENFPLRSETSEVTQDDWPVYVELTNSKIYGCDFVVSATGVIPNTAPFLQDNKFEVAEDGGFKVNDKMQTSVPDVYAAGDVCTASWTLAPLWMQMRLWCQARQMGAFSAQCMVAGSKGEDIELDFCFELFAHVTKFFNYKVVLLGKFNAQGLGTDHELLLRVTKGQEYVKVVLHNGRMHGAILIGETDLEETFENLILNQLDLTSYGESLLDPNIDIEDYFD